jgi:hypothetical protein
MHGEAENEGRSLKEGLKNSILQFFRRRESGAGPDSLALNQALACLIRERAIHGAREALIDQSFPDSLWKTSCPGVFPVGGPAQVRTASRHIHRLRACFVVPAIPGRASRLFFNSLFRHH